MNALQKKLEAVNGRKGAVILSKEEARDSLSRIRSLEMRIQSLQAANRQGTELILMLIRKSPSEAIKQFLEVGGENEYLDGLTIEGLIDRIEKAA